MIRKRVCYECLDRKIGCHAVCDKYIAERKKNDELRDRHLEEKKKLDDIYDYKRRRKR